MEFFCIALAVESQSNVNGHILPNHRRPVFTLKRYYQSYYLRKNEAIWCSRFRLDVLSLHITKNIFFWLEAYFAKSTSMTRKSPNQSRMRVAISALQFLSEPTPAHYVWGWTERNQGLSIDLMEVWVEHLWQEHLSICQLLDSSKQSLDSGRGTDDKEKAHEVSNDLICEKNNDTP